MIVLVCGGRDFFGESVIRLALTNLIGKKGLFSDITEDVDEIVHGRSTGADTIAGKMASELGLKVSAYPVTKEEWRRYGLSAGPMRNARMLRDKKPRLVIAFPGGKGTADMARQAGEAGVRVVHVAPF